MTANKGRKVGGDRHEETVYGPSWYDVYIIMKELQAKFPNEGVTLTLLPNTGYDKTAGLVVWCRNGDGTVLGSKRFLDRSPESAKTAAAAFWIAATRAYHALEEKQAVADGEYEQLDITDSEAGAPSSPAAIGD